MEMRLEKRLIKKWNVLRTEQTCQFHKSLPVYAVPTNLHKQTHLEPTILRIRYRIRIMFCMFAFEIASPTARCSPLNLPLSLRKPGSSLSLFVNPPRGNLVYIMRGVSEFELLQIAQGGG